MGHGGHAGYDQAGSGPEVRSLPNWTMQQAQDLNEKGWLTDAGLRTFKVCKRYLVLIQDGKKRGEAVLILTDEFNLSDKRIEQMIDGPGRKEEESASLSGYGSASSPMEPGFTYK